MGIESLLNKKTILTFINEAKNPEWEQLANDQLSEIIEYSPVAIDFFLQIFRKSLDANLT